MRMRSFVILIAVLGLGVAACTSSASLSLDKISSTTDDDSDAAGGDSESGDASSESAKSSDKDGSNDSTSKDSGGADSASDSGAKSSSEPVEGWSEITAGLPTDELAGEFDGLGEVDAKVYTKEGSEPGSADAYIIRVTVDPQQALGMAAFMNSGGDIGEKLKIGGKTVYKLSDGEEFGGCMLMWQLGGNKMTIAQSPGNCDELIPLVEQVI